MGKKHARKKADRGDVSPWLEGLKPALAAWPTLHRLDVISVGEVWGASFHTPQHHELLHVLEGRAEIQSRKKLFRVAAGDTFVIPQGTEHRDIREQGASDYRVLYVFFEWPAGADWLHELKPERLVKLPGAAKSHIHLMMQELADESRSDDAGALDRMHLLLLEILLALARYTRPAPPPPRNARTAAAKRSRRNVVEATCAYLKEHFADEIALDALAERHGVSPFNLSRWFSQEYGMTLMGMLTQIRIERARELLEGGQSVKETAAAVGYADGNYFSKVFRRTTGRSPSEFLARRGRAGT